MEKEELFSSENPRKAIIPSVVTKEAIKDNITKLREVFYDDQDSLIKIVSYIVNDFALPEDVDRVILNHYSTVIEQCKKEHKAWPNEIAQVRIAAGTLYNLANGIGELVTQEMARIKPSEDEKYDIAIKIGKLLQAEIGREFNPDIDYRLGIDPELVWHELRSQVIIESDDDNCW
jgi:hypothetical protein